MYSPSLSAAYGLSCLAILASSSSLANPPNGWAYQGCYSDSTSSRVLSGPSYRNSTAMTEESCIQYCGSAGYTVAGVEYADECYCGYQLTSSSTKKPDTDCNMPCSGNSSEVCGAGNRLTVFSSGTAAPTTNPGSNGWTSFGCYSDKTNARTLQNPEGIAAGANGMTVGACLAKCQQLNYQYGGVEYANECYCGAQIANGGSPISSGCNMACAGNSSEYCGGPNALNLYQFLTASTSSVSLSTTSTALLSSTPTTTSTRSTSISSLPSTSTTLLPSTSTTTLLSSASTTTLLPSASVASLPSNYSYLGCFSDVSSSRTLTHTYAVPGNEGNMTIENCINACRSHGYDFAGLEYSQECYCDDFIKNSGICISQTKCNMHCSGNSAELCGGSNALNVYQYDRWNAAVNSCCGIPASSSGVIQNGNFENGLSPWNVNPITPGSAQVSVSGADGAYSGCSNLIIRAVNRGSQNNNAVSISQTISGLAINQQYTFSMYTGWNTLNYNSGQSVLIKVGLATGELLMNEAPCGGSQCINKGQGGISAYGFMGYSVITPRSSTVQLYINVTWTGQMNGWDLLIDGVTLTPGGIPGY